MRARQNSFCLTCGKFPFIPINKTFVEDALLVAGVQFLYASSAHAGIKASGTARSKACHWQQISAVIACESIPMRLKRQSRRAWRARIRKSKQQVSLTGGARPN